MSNITVNFAVYGALAGGNENSAQAKNVTSILQNLTNRQNDIAKKPVFYK